MENERAIEILDPEHREAYESLEPVNEACRMGVEALRRRVPESPYPDGDAGVLACPSCGSGEYLHNEDGNRAAWGRISGEGRGMEIEERGGGGVMNCTILQGDALELLRTLPPESVHTCVTSPPYYNLRDYGVEGQIGNEGSVEEYLQALVAVFREVRRVLRPDGTLWVNVGDSYATNQGASRRRTPAIPADTPQSAYRRDTRKRPDRHTLAVGLCPPCRRLVFAARHHLAEAELYAGERERPMHEVT